MYPYLFSRYTSVNLSVSTINLSRKTRALSLSEGCYFKTNAINIQYFGVNRKKYMGEHQNRQN
jgi:hypothetical protein